MPATHGLRLALAVFLSAGPLAAATTTLPAASSIHGFGGTFYHSDVAVMNLSRSATASVTARFRCAGGSCGPSAVQTFSLPPRHVAFYPDIVVSLFSAPEKSGAIEFESSVPIAVTSRLYTPSKPQPTYGQFIPGLPQSAASAEQVLLLLSNSTDFARGSRSNVGAYNPGDADQQVTFTLYDATGAELGSLPRTIPARQPVQINDLFGVLQIHDDVPAAYCIVAGSAPLFAYASVLDNQSQDPIFVPGRSNDFTDSMTPMDARSVLPAVSSIHGQGGTFFHSDVVAYFPGMGGNLTAGYRCFTGPCSDPVRQINVPWGTLAAWDDAVVSLFGVAETAGAIEIDSFYLPIVFSRLYTPSKPQPTVGQFIPAFAPWDIHRTAVVTLLSRAADPSTGSRVNVGAFNPADVAQTLTFVLYDGDAVELGRTTRPAAARRSVQINDLFAVLGVTREVETAYCVVQGDGTHGVMAYASVLDNQSQDPIFVPAAPDDGCTYRLDSYGGWFFGAGSTLPYKVSAPDGCAWTVRCADPWLRVAGTPGSGSGGFDVTAEASDVVAARTSTCNVEGQTIAIEQARGNYDGTWKGKTGLGSLTFTVGSNQTRSWTVAFTADGSGCTIFGSVTQTGIYSITDGKLDASIGGSTSTASWSFHFTGTFSSLKAASGTVAYDISKGSCKSVGTTTWSAAKQ